ncbi:MAG: anthranilate synthase component I family protein [Ferrimicrobium sp.]
MSSPIVRMTRELLSDSLSPVAAYESLVGSEPGCIFESVDQLGRWSRFSFIGRRPLATITARLGAIDISGETPVAPQLGEGVLAYLDRLVGALGFHADMAVPFATGLIGYVGYDVVREVEPEISNTVLDDTQFPDATVFIAGEVVVFDHWTQQLLLIVNQYVPGGVDAITEEVYSAGLESLNRLERELQAARGFRPVPLPELAQDEERELLGTGFIPSYCDRVARAREYILAGDIFQVVLSHRFDFEVGARAMDLYRALRVTNPSPYMYLVKTPELAVVGSSPEALVTVRGSRVQTRPIAGTRRRGVDDQEDELLIADLLADPKERAEHVMLVDLARNDIGKVAVFHSCRVEEFMVPERYSRVIHLGSEVVGELRPDVTLIDVLRATLPAGTLSGAPKVRAMQIIDELEETRRSVYGGVVGYIGTGGSMDCAISIRTVVVGSDGIGHLQVGAGIVADSQPEVEAEEVVNKAAAVARAVLVARMLTAASSAGNGLGRVEGAS